MNLEIRKIDFLQKFLALNDEALLSSLEELLYSETDNKNLKPMTIAELNSRIDKSMDDSNNNRLTSTSDLIDEIEKWHLR